MITVVYGAKGSGKTKQILDQANGAITKAKGNLVYITDNKEHMYQIKRPIRYVDAKEYNLSGLDMLVGFIKGMFAVNHDIEHIFIDGAARIAKAKIEELEALINEFSAHEDVNFTLTVSSNYENLPDFIKKYIN